MIRRFQIPIAGRWYFGMLALIGTVSLITSNNVVYLMESLLISALLFSVIVSVKTVRGVRVEVRRRPICAQGKNEDLVYVVNRSRWPVYCLEVQEWTAGKANRLAFIPFLRGRSSVKISASAVYFRRGVWKWDAIGLSTTFPYGFIRFIVRFKEAGARIIWPPAISEANPQQDSAGNSQTHGGLGILEGEVRPMNHDDDPRSIVWTLSARGGDPMVRMRSSENQVEGLTLDLRGEQDESFEKNISSLASQLYRVSDSNSEWVSLTLVDWKGRNRIFGRKRILDCLATVQAAGSR